jgi:hypothetical protein
MNAPLATALSDLEEGCSYAFDRTTGRVVASCIQGIGIWWRVVLRDTHNSEWMAGMLG